MGRGHDPGGDRMKLDELLLEAAKLALIWGVALALLYLPG